MADNASNTSRMLALLAELRREMNGVAADAMRSYGGQYGVNYGVAAHTIREKASAIPHDHEFAEYLYKQDVRELRIAGLWIAEPERVTVDDLPFWVAGIINSEVAEQAALALFSHVECINEMLSEWSHSTNVLPCYAAMLAAARNEHTDPDTAFGSLFRIVRNFPDNRLAGQGAVALLVSVAASDRDGVAHMIESLPDSPTAAYVRDEMSWRLETI